MTRPSRVLAVVTDVDNTLYDWLAFYIPSFLAMIGELEVISGVPAEALKRSFRRVHQAHGTTEYPFSIQQIDALEEQDRDLSTAQRLEKYGPAIHAFRSMRKKTLRPFDGVPETLRALRERGLVLVAHSDAWLVSVSRRLRQLELDSFFDLIVAAEDPGPPEGSPMEVVRRALPAEVEARVPTLSISKGVRKPDVRALLPALSQLKLEPARCIYVGDSPSRDVAIARAVGAIDVWARYGSLTDRAALYDELVKISYFSETDVEEERRLRQEIELVKPSFEIQHFKELEAVCSLVEGAWRGPEVYPPESRLL